MSGSTPVNILYMEDDPASARLLQREMERSNFRVDLARDGQEGITMYQSSSYDVLAVDQNMPVLDGLQVIRKLAERGPLPPTIMITGAGDEKTAVEAMKLGASDYLVKDVDGGYLKLLPTVVEQVLYQRRLAEEREQALAALRQHNEDLALLNEAGQALTASLDLQDIMQRFLETARELVGAEGCSLWLWEASDQEEDAQEGVLVCRAVIQDDGYGTPVDVQLSPGQGIAGWVLEHGESILIEDASNDPRFFPEVDAKTGLRTVSLLAVPLRIRENVIGVLEAVNHRAKEIFDSHDLALVETLAASAAIAVDNARLIEALRQRTLELQAQNQELDSFAHTVAHDLKNPLALMVGYGEMLKDYINMPEAEVRDMLSYILRYGHKMANIINELMLLAGVRKTQVQLVPLDMGRIVAEAEGRLAFMIAENQGQIIIPSEWPAALGYAPWVEEVWANYISNALKYGGKPPRIELGGQKERGGKVRFWVRDNGPGISPKEQKRLFAPFTQLKQVRAEGHGLGLSIVRRIVEKLGGEVAVESQVGQGSTFSFTLPAAD